MLKSDTPLPPVNRTSETEHDAVMGGKKKYINIFRSFTEPFNYSTARVGLGVRLGLGLVLMLVGGITIANGCHTL